MFYKFQKYYLFKNKATILFRKQKHFVLLLTLALLYVISAKKNAGCRSIGAIQKKMFVTGNIHELLFVENNIDTQVE